MKEFIRGYLRFKVFVLVWIQLPSYASRRQKLQRLGQGRRQFDLISKALFVETTFSNRSIGEYFISDGESTVTPTTAYPSTDSPVSQFVSPTLTPSNLPMGPFITSATANERIIIPEPKKPVFRERYDCPHLQDSLLDWHAHTTWKNEVPFSGTVTLPHNSRIVIRESIVGLFQLITIPQSSELIFGENKEGITLDVHGIDVKGKLIIGSETCRIQTPVIITLHGDRPSDAVTNVPAPTVKGITVTGEIHIHGQRFFRTWTRLAATVEPGDSIIMLQHEVNWLPGQTIVLVTTAMKDSREWHRNELSTVDRVLLDSKSDVGAAVFLQSPVSFQHIANSGYQAEVGLLTRTVKIQGNWVSEPSDPDPLNCTSTRINYGDNAIPCPNKDLTGYGGHILIHKGGKGFVEGLELYRMGQTNVLGRYPIHFHLLGDKCHGCYFRDSSIHRSFYRCVSIHGTDHILIAENVAFDVIGFCYYLEDGVEQYNRIEFNLGAHIHLISPGDPPWSNEQSIGIYKQSENLILPADVAAAAFYITNVHNHIIGNAASGGWAGFAFPNLPYAIGENTKVKIRPSSVLGLTIDGNTAHSTGWWWKDASAFYFGGSLYYNTDDILEYEPGRDLDNRRSTCTVNKCLEGSCSSFCRSWEQAWMQVNNTKSFLVAGVGLGSWSGRVDVYGYECHDCGLSMKAQSSDGFSARHVLAVCRTYTPLLLPLSAKANELQADGFHWYDTGQEHILTDIIFKNCGYRSSMYSQYNPSPIRGCGDEEDIGCSEKSSVWTMITHSDLYVPEIMQGTKEIKFENCGRRFFQYDFRQSKAPQLSSNSGRLQNWYDMDGSITGLNQPSVLASGLSDAGMWWQVDNEVVYDPQGPLWFFKLTSGPQRGLGHFKMIWDSDLASQVGITQCGNGVILPCDVLGYLKHIGEFFDEDKGLPVTAHGGIVGAAGGFGWKLELFKGAPRYIQFSEVEVDPDTPLLLSIAYPRGTTFMLTAYTEYCIPSLQYSCQERFQEVPSIRDVRESLGNTFYVDPNGVITIRIIQLSKNFIGRPEFFLPQYDDVGRNGNGYALSRFEREGIRLPVFSDGTYLELIADCAVSQLESFYCSEVPEPYIPKVCPEGYEQTGYDVCSLKGNYEKKVFADGSTT